MKTKIILFLLSICLTFSTLEAQDCHCLNCPQKIEKTGILDSCFESNLILKVVGAENDNLSNVGQGVCQVNLDFKMNYIFDFEVYLISPAGDTVQLIGPFLGPGYGSTVLSHWEIGFVRQEVVPNPDIGYNDQWDNDQPWQAIKKYTGTYHPFKQSLNNFNSGPVNGNWILWIKNCDYINVGDFLDWSIQFCDDEGIDCDCLSFGGAVLPGDVIQFCQGDPELDVHPKTFFGAYQPDTLFYGYTYLLLKNNIIQDVDSTFDLTNQGPGSFKVCGLSYLLTDSVKIPKENQKISFDSVKNAIYSKAPAYCADLSYKCNQYIINKPQSPDTVNLSLCAGDCITIGNKVYCQEGVDSTHFPSPSGCDSILYVITKVVSASSTIVYDTICKGDVKIIGTHSYNTSGVFIDTLLNAKNCDSIVTLHLQVIHVDANIKLPDTLGCFHSFVSLDGSNSILQGNDIQIQWKSVIGKIEPDSFALKTSTLKSGVYRLILTQIGSDYICKDSSTVPVFENSTKPNIITDEKPRICRGEYQDLTNLYYEDLSKMGGVFTWHSGYPCTNNNKINPLVNPQDTTTYILCYQVGNCEDTLNMRVDVLDPIFVLLKSPIYVCNADPSGMGKAKLKFDTLIIGGNATGIWQNTDNLPIKGSFPNIDFTGVTPGVYTFTFYSDNAYPPCENIQEPLTVIVEDCACPSVTLTNKILCTSDVTFNLLQLKNGNSNGTFKIINKPPGTNPATIAGINLNISGKDPGTYTIQFKLNQNPPAGCVDTGTSIIQLEKEVDLSLVPVDTVCNSMDNPKFPTILKLNSLIVTLDTIGNWKDLVLSGATFLNPSLVSFNGVTPGNYPFEFQTASAKFPCQNKTDQLDIIVEDCTCPTIGHVSSMKFCIENTVINLNNLLQSPMTGDWSVFNTSGTLVENLNGNLWSTNSYLPDNYILIFKSKMIPVGCKDSVQIPIELNSSPKAELIPFVKVCNLDNGSNPTFYNFSNAILSGESSGSWKEITPSNAGGILPLLDYTGTAPGAYLYEYTIQDSTGICAAQKYPFQVIVEDCSCPSVAVFGTDKICITDSLLNLNKYIITNQPGKWKFLGTPSVNTPIFLNDSIVSIHGALSGQYDFQFTLNNASGGNCPDSSVFTLDLKVPPVIKVKDTITVCNQDSLQYPSFLNLETAILLGSPGGIWNNLDQVGSIIGNNLIDFQGVSGGNYLFSYHTITSELPCKEAFDTLIVRVLNCACPQIPLEFHGQYCQQGGKFDFTLLSTNSAPGTWKVFSIPLGGVSPMINNNTWTWNNAAPGEYQFIYTLSGNIPIGCPDTGVAFLLLDQVNDVGFDTITTQFCVGADTVLSPTIFGSKLGGNWIFKINFPGNSIGDKLHFIPQNSGQFGANYLIEGGKCPSDTGTLLLNVEAIPLIHLEDSLVIPCQLLEITIGDSLLSGVKNEQWEFNNMVIGNQNTVKVNSEGLYYFSAITKNAGCIIQDSIYVDFANGIQDITYSSTSATCTQDGSLILEDISGGTPPYQVLWNGNLFPFPWDVDSLKPGNYQVEISDSQGCKKVIQITIQAPVVPVINIGSDITLEAGESYQITAQFNIPDSIQYQLIWNPNVCTNCSLVTVQPPVSTEYQVQLITQDSCIAVDNILITVIEKTPIPQDTSLFYLPNVFSMDANGINDRWELFVVREELNVSLLQVFNRWGDRLLEKKNLHGIGSIVLWDPESEGQKVNPGVFVYYLEYETKSGIRGKRKGELIVIK